MAGPLHWVPNKAGQAVIYYPHGTDSGLLYDQELARMVCQRFNALVGIQDYDCLAELLDRLGGCGLPEYEQGLWRRALGRTRTEAPDGN